jgi:1-acyl-sn-glycerol-3-phosphate acyltransferase
MGRRERPPMYRLSQWLMRQIFRLIGKCEVTGLENIPKTGPFFVIANHQSVLDPLLIVAMQKREIHVMAKSTQFSNPLLGDYIARHCKSFPVRRYQIDPQSVRISLRRLAEGFGVGIFIEGERSWDGLMQQPRLGTLRLILKAGVQVIPVTIVGAYDVWPRWHRGIRRGTVRIHYGEPLCFQKLDRKADREAVLDETAEKLMNTLQKQIDADLERAGQTDES